MKKKTALSQKDKICIALWGHTEAELIRLTAESDARIKERERLIKECAARNIELQARIDKLMADLGISAAPAPAEPTGPKKPVKKRTRTSKPGPPPTQVKPGPRLNHSL